MFRDSNASKFEAVQRGRGLRLTRVRGVALAAQLGVGGLPDLSHAALAKEGGDVVVPDEVPGASPISLSAYRSCRDESLYAAFANEGAHVVVPERSPTFRAMSCAVCQTRLTGILRHQTGRLHRVTHDAHPGL